MLRRGERERGKAKKHFEKLPSNNFVYSDVQLYVCNPGPTKFSLIYLGSLQIPVARLYKRQHYQFLVVFRIFPLLQIKVSIFHPIDSIHSHSDVHESTFHKFPSRRFLSFHLFVNLTPMKWMF